MIPLTQRERQVLDLLCEEGYNDREMANRLGVSYWTIKMHMVHILQKTGYGTRLELVVKTLKERNYGKDS